MSSRRLRLLTLIGVGLITTVIIAGILLTYFARETRSVILPSVPDNNASETGGSLTPDQQNSPEDALKRLDITIDNVQKVIKTLQRPESYSRHIRIENFYSNGQNGAVDNSSITDIDVSFYNGIQSLEIVSGGSLKHMIMTAERMYIWQNNEKYYYEAPIQEAVFGAVAADEYQMILSYEDILGVDKKDILGANTIEYSGDYCIAVRFCKGQLGYITICYVSTASGLLVGAEQYDQNMRLVYRMTTSNYVSSVPERTAYVLPDGKNVLDGM